MDIDTLVKLKKEAALRMVLAEKLMPEKEPGSSLREYWKGTHDANYLLSEYLEQQINQSKTGEKNENDDS